MEQTRLIVVNGPIASGKTTVAHGLAAWARERGLVAAAIDMDDLIEIVRGTDWTRPWTLTDWRLARGLAAATIDRLSEQGAALVALAGPFFNRYERDELCGAIKSAPIVRFITLEASLEETQRRCAADDGRVLTKDPAFVARIFAEIDWKALPRDDLFLSTEKLTLDDVVDAVTADAGLR